MLSSISNLITVTDLAPALPARSNPNTYAVFGSSAKKAGSLLVLNPLIMIFVAVLYPSVIRTRSLVVTPVCYFLKLKQKKRKTLSNLILNRL